MEQNKNTLTISTSNGLTTEQLISQGYSREAAESHPANRDNIGRTQAPAEALSEPEGLDQITTTPQEALGAVAMAQEALRAHDESQQPVVDAFGNRMTREQFVEINSDPHTRMNS
jgi:hypothetical protein